MNIQTFTDTILNYLDGRPAPHAAIRGGNFYIAAAPHAAAPIAEHTVIHHRHDNAPVKTDIVTLPLVLAGASQYNLDHYSKTSGTR